MESHESLKDAIAKIGAKSVATDMSLSSSLIYKWCEPNSSPDDGGADNPLDRINKIYKLTGDTGPIEWLCQQANGFFVKNQEGNKQADDVVLVEAHKMLEDFSVLLEAVSKSISDDGLVDQGEAMQIRDAWEQLKSVAESFVTACESGKYG